MTGSDAAESDVELEAAEGLVMRTFGADLPTHLSNAERWSALREYLVAYLTRMLDRDFGRLPQLLYQIDVREDRVNQAFRDAATPHEIPGLLADLVIERAREIVAARRAYAERQERNHDG